MFIGLALDLSKNTHLIPIQYDISPILLLFNAYHGTISINEVRRSVHCPDNLLPGHQQLQLHRPMAVERRGKVLPSRSGRHSSSARTLPQV